MTLFLGGQAHGRNIPVEPWAQSIEIPVLRPLTAKEFKDPTLDAAFTTQRYQRQTIGLAGKPPARRDVFVLVGIPADLAYDLLRDWLFTTWVKGHDDDKVRLEAQPNHVPYTKDDVTWLVKQGWTPPKGMAA